MKDVQDIRFKHTDQASLVEIAFKPKLVGEDRLTQKITLTYEQFLHVVESGLDHINGFPITIKTKVGQIKHVRRSTLSRLGTAEKNLKDMINK